MCGLDAGTDIVAAVDAGVELELGDAAGERLHLFEAVVEVVGGGDRLLVQLVVHHQLADGALALGDLGGDDLEVGADAIELGRESGEVFDHAFEIGLVLGKQHFGPPRGVAEGLDRGRQRGHRQLDVLAVLLDQFADLAGHGLDVGQRALDRLAVLGDQAGDLVAGAADVGERGGDHGAVLLDQVAHLARGVAEGGDRLVDGLAVVLDQTLHAGDRIGKRGAFDTPDAGQPFGRDRLAAGRADLERAATERTEHDAELGGRPDQDLAAELLVEDERHPHHRALAIDIGRYHRHLAHAHAIVGDGVAVLQLADLAEADGVVALAGAEFGDEESEPDRQAHAQEEEDADLHFARHAGRLGRGHGEFPEEVDELAAGRGTAPMGTRGAGAGAR